MMHASHPGALCLSQRKFVPVTLFNSLDISIDAGADLTSISYSQHRLPGYTVSSMAEDTRAELERFRRQWQDEVSARNRSAQAKSRHEPSSSGKSRPWPIPSSKPPPKMTTSFANKAEEEDVLAESFDVGDLEEWEEARKLGGAPGVPHPGSSRLKPVSALEHYEKAVERETQGNLGDSLNLYRKAFRVSRPLCSVGAHN